MKDLIETLIILYRDIPAGEILAGHISYNEFEKNQFKTLLSPYREKNSHLETEYLFDVYRDKMKVQDEKLYGRAKDWRDEKTLNVFELLLSCAQEMLLEINGEPQCRYQNLLEWRAAAHPLGEEVFVSAFLAWRDLARPDGIRDFRWPMVIRSNNIALQKLLQRGIAENHFHLKGSAPYFQLSWISLMNQINNRRFRRKLESYEKYRLSRSYSHNSNYQEETLAVMHRQAALIRYLLFLKLRGRPLILEEYRMNMETLRRIISLEGIQDFSLCIGKMRQIRENHFRIYEKISVGEVLQQLGKEAVSAIPRWFLEIAGPFWYHENLFGGKVMEMSGREVLLRLLELEQDREISLKVCLKFSLITRSQYDDMTGDMTFLLVQRLLGDPEMMDKYSYGIQWNMECFKNEYMAGKNVKLMEDYALGIGCPQYYRQENAFGILAGERYILYEMFKSIYSGRKGMKPYIQLFYAYLVIKEKIRAELIQVNRKVGFDNFNLYQDRKEDFIEDTPLESWYLKLAVRETLHNAPIHALEARITPRRNAVENRNYIKKQDKQIGLTAKEQRRMFYVFHFVKEGCKERELSSDTLCRHSSLRAKVRRQAMGVANLRYKYPREAERVLGIDACNNELICRPEVFAHAFRFLRNHNALAPDLNRGEKRTQVKSLGITYHVGEDFLDVTDGLRAIEEAWHFLSMRCGDRFGHALVLGINVRQWYESKGWKIKLTKQDYLDNIVWLYINIRKLKSGGYENLLLRLEQEYSKYFQEVYRSFISEEAITQIRKNEEQYWRDCGQEIPVLGRSYQFDITVYYEAWKLRGDDPACYVRGFFKPSKIQDYSWDCYMVNEEYPRNYEVRWNSEASYLYYLYQYNPRVKLEGNKKVEIAVSQDLCNAVGEVQRNLQMKIAEAGIGIEANPSSNQLIGTFRRYEDHPMLNLNNEGLVPVNGVQRPTPQVSISINTDDQGVFVTSLENEYALMAAALEEKRDENGEKMYSRRAVMDWLDRVRVMGLDQCFLDENLNIPMRLGDEAYGNGE